MHFGPILGLQSGLGSAEMCGSGIWRRPGVRPLILSAVDEQVAHRILKSAVAYPIRDRFVRVLINALRNSESSLGDYDFFLPARRPKFQYFCEVGQNVPECET